MGRTSWGWSARAVAIPRAAVLGVVPGALDVLDAGADVHGGAVLRPGRAGVAREIRQSVERQVDLAAGAFDAIFPDGRDEIRSQMRCDPTAAETSVAGRDCWRRYRRSISSPLSSTTPSARPFSHAGCSATGALVRISAPLAARRVGDGVRHRAHSAAHESPQSAMPATPPITWCSRM